MVRGGDGTIAGRSPHPGDAAAPPDASDAPEPEERRRRILAAVRAIPEGFVATYADVSPGAPRLAGRVLATTHEPDLPWWRVVRADGSLAVGEKQRRRLWAEGIPFRPGNSRVDMDLARLPDQANL